MPTPPTLFLAETAFEYMRARLSESPEGTKLKAIIFEAPEIWHEPEYEGKQFATATAIDKPSEPILPVLLSGMAKNRRYPLYAINITRLK